MIWLALRLVLHNSTRLVVTLVAVIFSSYLTLTEVALYIGMMQNATSVIRHSGADLWIASKGIQNFDFPKLFPEDRVKQVLGLPDVLWAKQIILTWGFLKLGDGAQEQVEIIGYEPLSCIGGPWAMEKGDAHDVRDGPYMIVDESARQRLGDLRLGSTWELNDRKVKLIGISRSAKTFTTAPIVFTSYSLALDVSSDMARRDSTAFIAVKVRDAAAAKPVITILQQKLKDNEILSTSDFVKRTIMYWTAQTGMGAALCLTAVLGLVVGTGVIGQTIFANTMEHLGELATLKAMGATRADLYTVIIGQALINVLAGYGVATLLVVIS